MQCKELESVLESGGLGPLPPEARAHLASCVSCQGFLADLETIVSVARTIPAEVEPPARLWVSLRAQLEAERLIREDIETSAPRPASWWESLLVLPRLGSLAAVGVVLAVVVMAVYLTRRPTDNPSVATDRPTPAASQPAPQETTLAAETPAPAPEPAPAAPRKTVVAKNSTSGVASSSVKDLKPSPSESASVATLSGEGPDFSIPGLQPSAGDAPVDAALRQNLRTLNEFIAECERHLRQNPHDELAREYLNAAYQQKADLIAAMMESARSEH